LNVLRTLLRKAFPIDGTAPQDTFTEVEGLEFLASELGVSEPAALPAAALAVAALVGYQKLALQMVGNMRVPVSKKKRAWEWSEVTALINKLRCEVGIVHSAADGTSSSDS
jgi:hypothetical protein